jgi:PAS domain S-box-containing protein
VLDVLTQCAEQQSSDEIFATILLLDRRNNQLIRGSAPSLPAEFRRQIEGKEIGPGVGCCGTAAFLKREVIVGDIENDPLWKNVKNSAIAHGLRACWSLPIVSSNDHLLATFAIYYTRPQTPTREDRHAIELLSRTAGIVIEWYSEIAHRQEVEAALRKSDQHLRALITATTDVIYRMSADWKKMWTLYGQNFLADTLDAIDDWQSKYIAPEDRETVDAAINKAIQEKTIFQLEHRVVKADGSTGWTFSRAIPILDHAGKIIEWYGVATDVTERKRNETFLGETLSLLESILKNAPIGYALINNKYEYLQVNDALATINGISAAEHIGKSVADVLPANSKDLIHILHKIFETGEPVHNIELKGEVASKPGVERSWLITFYPVKVDGSPEVKYVGAAVLEITDRIKTEQALRESEKQFRDFSNSIQNLAWMARGDGWIYWYNQRWYNYTGTTEEEMQGWGWTKVHHPDHVKRTTEFIRNAWLTGEQWELTFPLKSRNGEYRWFLTRAYPIKNEQGKVTQWMGTNTDIHDKLQIQEELEQSRNSLRQISDFMPQIVWTTDAKGYHDFFNKRWYEFTGMTFEETKGEAWAKLLHPEDFKRTDETWRNCLKSGKEYEIEYRMKRHDGNYRWLLARAIPLRRGDGTIERWYGTCTDIHDQKTMSERLEDLVQERTKELRRSNEDLQQYAHVASHDLKEPVRKIQFFEDLISNKYQETLPEEVNQSLQRIRKSANRISAMIEGVLLYSSVDGSMMILDDIDLNQVLHDVATDLELVIAEKNVAINYENLPVIKGVPTLIYQLFYNLVNNSVKFSKPGRPLVIDIDSKHVSEDGRLFWQIVLEDNGIGFSDKHSETIFRTFIRLNPKDKYEGTGLGLALCKKIVERHGGSIRATGRENEGATFTIMLPAKDPTLV